MKKGKRRMAAVLSLMLVPMMAACSSGGNNGNSGNSVGGETVDTLKEVKLKIGLPAAYDATRKEIIDGFIASHPHIKVDVQDAPWGDFTAKIATQIAGNTAPDIWFQENAAILGYGKRGVAEDLSAYIERDLKEEDYIEALYAAKTPDGHVYGVPHGINPAALAFNKKVFAAAGVSLPTDDWTFNDLIENAKLLTKKEAGSETEIYGLAGTAGITQGWFPFIKMAGGQALDETKTKAMFDNPQTIAGLQAMQDGVKEGYFTSREFVEAQGGDQATLANGKAAMYIIQYSNQVTMNRNFPDADWDVVKIPKSVDGNRYVPMVTNSWLIYSKAKPEVKEAAWEFLKYYLSEEAQALLAESGAALPVNKAALAKVEQNTNKPLNKKAFTEGIAESGTTLDENASWNEWRGAAQPIITDIYDGKISVSDAVKEIQEKVQAVLDQNA
ncbi:ABC transporter substrate-binding protein [Paenibacillus sp. GCM10027626]|uniref:ABC transporter substrate-binding protein n=1 Tax=Paenibacillus sp. GCM10027626 TaxID=3273411 RepID=UPI003631E0D3